jgi:cytochrome c biogenesis protein CcdA
MGGFVMDAPMINLDVDKDKKPQARRLWVALGVPALLVVAILFAVIALRDGAEQAMNRLTTLLPVGYAFAAGMVASMNPCGVLMLPSYVLYQLNVLPGDSPLGRRVLRGLLVAVAVTFGFLITFAVAGSVITAGGRWLVRIFPYAGLLVGVAMTGLGIWLLMTHRTFGLAAASRLRIERSRSLLNMVGFGVVFAVGSLSCTLPIFLVVVGSSLTGEGWVSSLGQFAGYALGMGAIITAVTVGTAALQDAVAKKLQRFSGFVHRFGALFLIGSGAYLIYYWLFIAGLA